MKKPLPSHLTPLIVISFCLLIVMGILLATTQLRECVTESLKDVRYVLFRSLNPLHEPLRGGHVTPAEGAPAESAPAESGDKEKPLNNFFKRGDIVLIEGHTIAYVGTKPLTKRIVGLPGDTIIHEKNALILLTQEGTDHNFPLLDKTTDGNSLTPLKVSTLPEGLVFVAGNTPNSFDSRYEEFGLVPVEKITGKGVLWW